MKINYSPGSLQRELTTLVDDGLLIAEKMGNLRFFSLNTKSPLIKELKHYLQAHENDAPAPKSAPKKSVLKMRPPDANQERPPTQMTTQPTEPTIRPTTQPAVEYPPPARPYEPSFYKPDLAKPIFSKPDLTPPSAEGAYKFDYSEPDFDALKSPPMTDDHLSYQPEPAPKKDDENGNITLHID